MKHLVVEHLWGTLTPMLMKFQQEVWIESVRCKLADSEGKF
jgi:hypothetical protein